MIAGPNFERGATGSGEMVWPDLSSPALAPTISTLHLWTQMVGKVRLGLTPWENHGWHVPLYVTARGLGSGLVPLPGRSFSMEFDFVGEVLKILMSDGQERILVLRACAVADFHKDFLGALSGLGIDVAIGTMPVELPDALRFEEDVEHRSYDPAVARTYWRALVEVHRVFQLYRTRFEGKCSPVHLFWGGFDLAVTRFSGRSAPRHPGGALHMPDAVAREAYSREVSSAGFWPNLEGADGPCFYSYAYPVPEAFGQQMVLPGAARFDGELGEFLLPYAAVASSDDPDAAILDFLQSTYVAAADLAAWDRNDLERPQGALGRPPVGS